MGNYKGSREAFSTALYELAEKDERILFVSSDSLKAMRATIFAERFPTRYIETGISEQCAADISSGLASCGMIPFWGTYAGFISMRACEQVRTFISYTQMNVKMVGINGGMLGGEREGVTHQALEDLGIMRTIPGITILTPADQYQVYGAVKVAAEIPGPVYIRCASGREPIVYDENVLFEFGKIRTIIENGHDVAIFSSGFVLDRCIQAADILKKKNINVKLIDVSTIKPIDKEGIIEVLKKCGCAVTVEDHNVIGGLGSAISEVVTDSYPVPVVRIGLEDQFSESGDGAELLNKYHIGVNDIVEAAEVACKKVRK